mgnify:FL=1
MLIYMDNIQNMQKLMGGNPMIKSVLSNPEHMAKAQEMLKNPETQKQIGGIIANPEIMQKAATMLDGLHKMNMNGGGRKVRRKKKGLMCPKNCCGLPVTKCGCPKSCGHCNCKEIQRLRKLLRKKSTRKKKSKRRGTKKKRRKHRKRTKKKRKRRRR